MWWALGIADFIWIIMAIPMLSRMAAWRRQGRRVRAPAGFGLWVLFIVCAVAGVLVLSVVAPGNGAELAGHRLLSYTNRTLTYVGVTVVLLYACNLTEHELPRRKLAYLLGLMAIYTTAGGLAGMAASHVSFKSPFLLILPHSVQANPFIQASMHPGLSQYRTSSALPRDARRRPSTTPTCGARSSRSWCRSCWPPGGSGAQGGSA